MRAGIKRLLIILGAAVLTIACVTISYFKITDALESTNRNELYAPERYNVQTTNTSQEGYVKIYENNNFEYFYNSNKTILKILNKKSGFVWSTGADTETKANTLNRCTNVGKDSSDYYSCILDIGPSRTGADNENGYAEINGLLYFTYLDKNTASKQRETVKALTKNTTSTLLGHSSLSNEWMFKLTYAKDDFDFKFNLRFTFTEDGFDIHMYDEDVYGESRPLVEAIYPLPRLGQSGGKILKGRFVDEDGDGIGDVVFDDLNNITDNPNTNLSGYIFVPDGSGALIRFDNIKYYSQNKTFYYDMYMDPYRENPDQQEFQSAIYTKEPDYVAKKHISMPVWGVSYGNNQDAFVAYVTEGSEYFGLSYQGRSTTFEYASIQPRFERNRKYTFVFGSSTSTLILDEKSIYTYDFGVSYNFLQGDGSDGTLPANYVGMALKYRSYLEKNGLIRKDVDLMTGPRVDFLICDVKEGLFGTEDVNVTTCDDIVNILSELNSDGISQINSTLFGWQTGGISKAKPWTTKYNKKVGGKAGFKEVVNKANEFGYKINFYQQYGLINSLQVKSFNAYCVKALSRDYGAYVLSDSNKPITWWEYVNANVSGRWLNRQANELAKLGDNVGITTGGISTLLIPDYGKKMSYKDSANALYQATKQAATKVSLTGDTPNSYLWRNYDSFTNLSVYNSQIQCETDSVPFLEIVFSGLVNLYAEYANFSFYDKISQLKMIDYNLNPSFIISATENSNIMYTNARDWFTTAYNNYHDIINEICSTVLPILNEIKGKTIIKREVVEFESGALGLYVNTYASVNNGNIGNDKTVIAVNYFDYDVNYNFNGQDVLIKAKSAQKLM